MNHKAALRRSLHIINVIVRKELLQVRHDRKMLGVSIAAPVLQVLLLGYAATTDITNSDLVVCDQDRTQESREFIREFTSHQPNFFRIKFRYSFLNRGIPLKMSPHISK